jgi:hypothetical protein
MKERELETKSAGYYAFAAARDARMKATAMWSHYTEAERTRAGRMALGLELCYFTKQIYINPRGKFISIKVDKPTVKDRKNLKLLEQDYEKAGITKAVTEQAIIYRIPKV